MLLVCDKAAAESEAEQHHDLGKRQGGDEGLDCRGGALATGWHVCPPRPRCPGSGDLARFEWGLERVSLLCTRDAALACRSGLPP